VEAERRLPAGAVCGTRTQPIGTEVQEYLLEPETAGELEHGMKSQAPKDRRRDAKPPPKPFRQTYFNLKNIADIKVNNSNSLFQSSHSIVNSIQIILFGLD
jgi:hypothetical protein